MKNKFLLTLLAGSMVLTSCLKDDNITDRVYGLEGVENVKIVEIHDGPDHTFSYDESSTAADYEIFEVRLNATAASDVVVTLEEDQALIDAYNTEHHTTYAKLSSNLYTLNGLSVTIPKGSISKKVSVNLKTADLITGGPYALGVKVKSISDPAYLVSGNFNSFVAVLGAKNKYDGMYSYSGEIYRNSATGPDPALSGIFTNLSPRALITLSPNSVSLVPLWANGGGIGGIDQTYITVDPVTNLVTMASKTNALLKNTPGEVNKYDPATKTFTLAFDWGVAPNTRVTKMTLTYTGPR